MANTANPARAIILSDGALGEWGSTLAHGEASVIADMPGIATDDAHKPIVSADYLGYTVVPKKSDGLDAYLDVRGVGAENAKLRPEIRLVSGRMFRPGQYEIIVGKSAQSQFLPILTRVLPLSGVEPFTSAATSCRNWSCP